MDSYIMYGAAVFLLCISFAKDKMKTKMALKTAWKAFEGILPQFFVVLLLIGFLLTVLNTDTISGIIGAESGWFGTVLAAIVGSVTLIPGFIAFSTAAVLLENGAGHMQIAAFISTLMMVGLITLPVEIRYFGKKISILRNILSFLFAFIVAAVIGLVMI